MQATKKAESIPPALNEAKARYELSWLVNEAFVTLNVKGTCCFGVLDDSDGTDIARRILDLCQMHPHLAVEYFTVEDTGEKVTLLEVCLRNHMEPVAIQEFCDKFPETLQVKTFASRVYPLHVACEEVPHGDGQVLIPFLASRFPEAVWTCDDDGSLPLHKVLKRLARAPRAVATSQEAPEIQALVELFPDSTITRGMDLAGQDPLHYVLAHHFPPAVVKSVLSHIPETVNRLTLSGFYFAGGMASITREYAEAFEKFLPQLEHLVFHPSHTTVTPIFTPEGWASFFGRLAECPMLEHLEMELPYGLLTEDTPSAVAFAETLPQLTGLTTLIFSFPRGAPTDSRDHDRHTEVLVSKPVGELIMATGGNLRNLIVKDGIAMDPEPIFKAIMEQKKSALVSLDIRTCSGKDRDMSQPLADLIASNCKLESLFVKNSALRCHKIFEALAHNTNLKSLALPNLIVEESESDITTTATLSSLLHHHNATLERIQCLQSTFQQTNSAEHQKIQHYASLNRFGRAGARQVTCNGEDMIDLLVAAQQSPALKHRENERASVLYGLLREAPNQWTSGHLNG